MPSPQKPDFYPPRLNPALTQLVQSISPMLGHFHYRMQLEIDPDSLNKLTALKGQRTLLLPNHPTFHDWIAIFLLSARINQLFYYLAAYERFKGVWGLFLQQLGAYSIRRGLGDRPSVAKTLELMMQSDCRLVIFPEGGCSLQNDTVMPFRVGSVQVAFQAMHRLVRQGEAVPDFYTVPVSIKYYYTSDMAPVIQKTLSRLERKLYLPPQNSSYERLRAIAAHLLEKFEHQFDFDVANTSQINWNERITSLKLHVLQSCEQKLGITPAPGTMLRERVYRIQHVLESRAESLAVDDFWTYDAIHQAAAGLLNFDAIYDGYVADHPTPERFLDTLTRLERTVFNIDQPPPKGYRKVRVCVGEPINLKDHFEEYLHNRAATVTLITEKIQQTVQQNLGLLLKRQMIQNR
jgi:1-acyl-sn-glycerol-3-phosphate acyltransferase